MSIDYKGANDLAAKSAALSQKISANASDIGDLETECEGKQAALTTLAGYDSSKTQVLKNIEGVLTWVTEE